MFEEPTDPKMTDIDNREKDILAERAKLLMSREEIDDLLVKNLAVLNMIRGARDGYKFATEKGEVTSEKEAE